METIDDGGEWWLPEAPDRRVSGWLTFTPDDGAKLRLVGSFHSLPNDVAGPDVPVVVRDDRGTYPRILGQIGSQAFTLEDCFRSQFHSQLLGGLPTETIRADRVYRGVWYEPHEEACGDGIRVNLAHLLYWVRPAALSEVWRWPVEGGQQLEEPVLEMAARDLAPIVLERPAGTLKLTQQLGVSGDGIAVRTITQDFVASLDVEDVRPWRNLLGAIGELQDVVSLAMDRVACIEAVALFHPDLVDTRPKGQPHRRPIEMFARWSDRTAWMEPTDVTPSDALFHYHVVGAEGLGRLLDAAAKYRAELRRVIATRRDPRMYNSDRLLNRCAALESFDRLRLGPGRRSFKRRMRACIELAGEPFMDLVGETEAWVELLRHRRDHVAHHLLNEDEDRGATDLVMAESVYFLFALCFLRAASSPSKVFELIEANRRIGWLRRQLSEVLGTGDQTPRVER